MGPQVWCRDCSAVSGGCWRHNGGGIYVSDEYGVRMTHVPDRIATPNGWTYFYRPITLYDPEWCYPQATTWNQSWTNG